MNADRVVSEVYLRQVWEGAQDVYVVDRKDLVMRNIQHCQVGKLLFNANQ